MSSATQHKDDLPASLDERRTLVRRQFDQLKGPAEVTCVCERTIPVRFAFQCLYCGVWRCMRCAEIHFGKTREEYNAERSLQGEGDKP